MRHPDLPFDSPVYGEGMGPAVARSYAPGDLWVDLRDCLFTTVRWHLEFSRGSPGRVLVFEPSGSAWLVAVFAHTRVPKLVGRIELWIGKPITIDYVDRLELCSEPRPFTPIPESSLV